MRDISASSDAACQIPGVIIPLKGWATVKGISGDGAKASDRKSPVLSAADLR
jgi:hypothetical protein